MQIREFVINEVRWIALNNLVLFLLDFLKNAPEKWFVWYFSEVHHPIRGSYPSFCDNVISDNLIPSVLQSEKDAENISEKDRTNQNVLWTTVLELGDGSNQNILRSMVF